MIVEGQRTKARRIGNQKAKMFFQRNGIRECEIKYEGCTGRFGLSFAHDVKSVNLSLEELAEPDMDRLVLACVQCHHVIEHDMSPDEMGNLVRKISGERNQRLIDQQANQNSMPKEKPKEKPKKKKANICPKCGYGTGHMAICSHCGERVT